MPWPPLNKFKFASCFPPQHTTVPGGTPRTGVLRSGHAEGRRPQVGTPNHPSWSNMFFFDMFFGIECCCSKWQAINCYVLIFF